MRGDDAPATGFITPAAQGAQKASEVAPRLALHVPAGHAVHELLKTAPSAPENVPGGHGVGVAEAPGQKDPGGHVCVMAAPLPVQNDPGGQGEQRLAEEGPLQEL